MKAEDYEVVKVIGRGAFGEVQLVRMTYYVSLVNNVFINFHGSCSIFLLLQKYYNISFLFL